MKPVAFVFTTLAGIFLCLFLVSFSRISAEDVTTSVIVGNSYPSFTVQPYEVTTSSSSSPTNVGSTVTFTATATDGNNDNYYLAICKGNNVTPHNNDAPTCNDGNWCISGSTTSGQAASCGYGTLNGDAQSNAWYAFVCDYSASSACSESSQGVGDSGSPFDVNHAPFFPTITNNSPLDPGSTMTWSTSVGASDPDADNVKLVVCKTTGISNGACDGGTTDTWCNSSTVSTNPSCEIGVSIPSAATGYNAYAYLFDAHNFGPTGGNQGVGISFVVNNVAPVVSAITLNGGSAISLSEGVTTPVVLGATITDNNGCSDISTITSSLYRSGVGATACDTGGEANSNNCYPVNSCSIGGGNTCDGATDASASYQCSAYLKSYADPTDTNTQYPSETWKNTFFVTDGGSLSVSTEIGSGVVLNSLLAMDIGSSLAYGNVSAGQSVDPLSKLTVVTATGNVGLDEELSGTDMSDGQAHTIAVGYQKYALSPSTAYAVGTTLSVSATEAELNCKKTTTDVGETKPTYWGIQIPNGTIAGSYSGTNTVIAKKGESVGW